MRVCSRSSLPSNNSYLQHQSTTTRRFPWRLSHPAHKNVEDVSVYRTLSLGCDHSRTIKSAMDDQPPSYSDPATDPAMGAPVHASAQHMIDYGAFPAAHYADPQRDNRCSDECTPCKMMFAVLWLCGAITVVVLAIRNVAW